VMTVLLAAGHVLFFFLTWKKIRGVNFAVILTIVAVAGIILMATAPGNKIREGYFPAKHQLLHSILYSFLQTGRFAGLWLLSVPLWLATLLYFPLAKRIKLPDSFRINPIFSAFILLAIIFCCAFPAYWGTGILGQHRTLNTACFVFLLYWFFNLHAIAGHIKQSLLDKIYGNVSLVKVLPVLLVLSVFLFGNGFTSTGDLISGRASGFDKEVEVQNSMLLDCKQQGIVSCRIPFIKTKPESIFVLDIQPDSSHWINFDLAAFYGLKYVMRTDNNP
jgi:hypothetical protein